MKGAREETQIQRFLDKHGKIIKGLRAGIANWISEVCDAKVPRLEGKMWMMPGSELLTRSHEQASW